MTNTLEIPRAITTAVASMLSPYCDGLTPEKLLSAISSKPDDKHVEKLCARKEAAPALHVSLVTIDRMLATGQLTPVRIRGRVFIRQSEIDRILNGVEA